MKLGSIAVTGGGLLVLLAAAAGTWLGGRLGDRPGETGQRVAGVVGGLISRDAETRSHIRESAEVQLPPASAAELRLVVTKSRYRLDVLVDGERRKTFPIALGDAPLGTKLAQGDERTPEGDYVLIPHHESPSFGRCFYISYPGVEDTARGLRDGSIDRTRHDAILRQLSAGSRPAHDTPLGGLILLHGRRRPLPMQTGINWTDGCIAMENEHLEELLALYEPSDRPVLTIAP